MTALLEKALTQVKLLPDADQDAVAARFLRMLAEYEREKQLTDAEKLPPIRKAGTATGTFWMAEDFDAPLEDFKEYM